MPNFDPYPNPNNTPILTLTIKPSLNPEAFIYRFGAQHFGPQKVVGPHRHELKVFGPHKCNKTRPHTHTHIHRALFLISKFYRTTQTYKQTHNLRHTQLHLTAQTHKLVKLPSVSQTHTESFPSIHMQTEAFSITPTVVFMYVYGAHKQVLYSQYGRLCLVHYVLYSQLQIVNMTFKTSINTLQPLWIKFNCHGTLQK